MTNVFVDIADIKNGAIILKNRALRSILKVSSLNFDLKSQDEQKAIIYGFQNFLNSLDFPVEITVQSRRLNIKGYLEELGKRLENQDNELLNIQTSEYIEFVRGLVSLANIMSKSFFIVVPFSPIEAKRESIWKKVKQAVKPAPRVRFTTEVFSRYREQLWQRVEHISAGLAGLGVEVEPLSTTEILELFYKTYNPING